MTESDKETVLNALQGLANTCTAGLDALRATTVGEQTQTKDLASIIRKDTISTQKLIYHSTTRLSIALGKPPPSYNIALEPINELSTQVGQLVSCISFFPSGILRQEVFWAAEGTIEALSSLAKHFLDRCRKDVVDEEYLAKTGAIHGAVEKATKVSQNEFEAFVKAWKSNGEALKDSLDEVEAMLEETDVENDKEDHDDGWDDILEAMPKLSKKELERVKKLYPLFRFTTLLHEKVLSDYIPHIKYSENSGGTTSSLRSLMSFSNSILMSNDDLASALYAPQDLDNVRECVDIVKELVTDFDKDLGITKTSSSPDELAAWLQKLSLGYKSESTMWFRKCFQQIQKLSETASLLE